MTKKDNKREVVRQVRRVLNNNLEYNQNVSGRRLNHIRYGGGLTKNHIKLKEEKCLNLSEISSEEDS